jgi:hypothetical protein
VFLAGMGSRGPIPWYINSREIVCVWDFMFTMNKLVIVLGDGLFWIGSK